MSKVMQVVLRTNYADYVYDATESAYADARGLVCSEGFKFVGAEYGDAQDVKPVGEYYFWLGGE
jgi:hypothetical protein